MTTRDPITPATTVLDILARQAAEHRLHARQQGIAAQDAKPALTDAANELAAARDERAEIERQLADLEEQLHTAQQDERHADAKHRRALALHARHEAEARQAADIAESLDRIAAQMREQAPVPPAEALAATGLLPTEPAQVVDLAPHVGHDVVIRTSGGTKVAGHLLDADREHARIRQPDDTVCTVAPADVREIQRVREIDPPPGFDPDTDLVVHADPFDVPPAPREPVATPPVPTAPAGDLVATTGPTTTMPDVGLNPRPLPPAPADGKARHEKPSDGLMSRVTGGFKALLDKSETTDQQQGDDQ